MNRWAVLDFIPTWRDGAQYIQLNTTMPATPKARFLLRPPTVTMQWRRVRGVMMPCDPNWSRMTDYLADPDVTISDTVFLWGVQHFPYNWLIYLEFIEQGIPPTVNMPGPVFAVLNTWPPPVCPVCNATTENELAIVQGTTEAATITSTNTLEEV